jgi:hypothetical protein
MLVNRQDTYKIRQVLARNFRHFHGDTLVEGNALEDGLWIGGCVMSVSYRAGWNSTLFPKVDHFGNANGGHADVIALGNRTVYEIGGSFPQACSPRGAG